MRYWFARSINPSTSPTHILKKSSILNCIMTSDITGQPGARRFVASVPNECLSDPNWAITFDAARKAVQKLEDELAVFQQLDASASSDDKPYSRMLAAQKADRLQTARSILLEYEREESRREAARQRQLATTAANAAQSQEFMMVIIEHHNDGPPSEAPPSYEEATRG